MKNLLLVDDEPIVLETLNEWFRGFADDFHVYTASNGKSAADILRSTEMDLVITDLNMPKMDGFELLAYINKNFPSVHSVVMSAYGTDEIRKKIRDLGVLHFLEKPLDFTELEKIDFEGMVEGSTGHLSGISLLSFLQLIDMEKKTCTLKVRSLGSTGTLYILKGELMEAETDNARGEQAAYEIIGWPDAEIEIENSCKIKKKNIQSAISELLMEACRRQDENEHEREQASEEDGEGPEVVSFEDIEKELLYDETPTPSQQAPERAHAAPAPAGSAEGKLKELAAIDGFGGAMLLTPAGEALQSIKAPGSSFDLNQIGVLVNNVLVNAKKTLLDMGTGRGKLVHIEAEDAHILARCLNEGPHPIQTESGKAHVHLVLILTEGNSIGLAKIKVQSVIEQLAEWYRL